MLKFGASDPFFPARRYASAVFVAMVCYVYRPITRYCLLACTSFLFVYLFIYVHCYLIW